METYNSQITLIEPYYKILFQNQVCKGTGKRYITAIKLVKNSVMSLSNFNKTIFLKIYIMGKYYLQALGIFLNIKYVSLEGTTVIVFFFY